ncbi:thioredoxin-like domain-containing protein [Blastopirellula marina]|nr:thioredoxin-like domain-containing protein [Blastopirellula marina]
MQTNRNLCICLLIVSLLSTTGCGPSQPAVVAAAEEGRKTAEQTDTAPAEKAPPAEGEAVAKIPEPFPRRIPAPEFPTDMEWMNTSGPVRLRDLRGKFVLLDFWTYCCINCIHILPELKKLEHEFPNELVVIGVHSAKFENEGDAKNIAEAILRYEIEHPVVNDNQHRIWNSFFVRSWPSMYLIDPEGNVVYGKSGEFEAKEIAAVLNRAIPYYEQQGTLDRTPIRFELLAYSQEPTPLRFPGKVLADEKSDRLFIADSNHNRIVIADLDGKLIETIGNGAIGTTDGDYATASFHHLQGMALDGDTLYVADTENHMLRKVDLKTKQVTTIAGKGVQGRNSWPGIPESGLLRSQVPDRFVGKPLETALNSPWALWVKGDDLYIAMAGPHQIWKMKLDGSEIGPYAGNGREDIVDGPLLPPIPYEQGFSSFAQPSGLTSDGTWLYVADSEGSSIRAVPFDPKEKVRTVTGSAHLGSGRLFAFGDKDGSATEARLQHALGVCYVDGQIYIADTYNCKIRVADAKTGEVRTVAGTGEHGADDAAPTFDEPAGLSYAAGKLYIADTNNHLIRTIDLKSKQVKTLTIAGLTPPSPPKVKQTPKFSAAEEIVLPPTKVTAANGQVNLNVDIQLPPGWKINTLAPTSYYLEGESTGPAQIAAEVELVTLAEPKPQFSVSVPVAGEGKSTVKLSLRYYYCEEGVDGLCKTAEVRWSVPLEIVASGGESAVPLATKPELGL